jgi:hypothetical protein
MRMNMKWHVIVLSLLRALDCSALARGGNSGTICPQPVGANLIIGNMTGPSNYASEQVYGVWYDAASFGITLCNVGDTNAEYSSLPSNRHPVFGQSVYKLTDGRIEQIGISWLFHGFAALAGNDCGCGCNGAGGGVVGAGCSNPHTSASIGSQVQRSPRWQVNAFTGDFPPGNPANPPYSGTTARRLRMKTAELEPSGAAVKYFAEHLIVAPQEASLGNQYDNASYVAVNVTGGSDDFDFALSGPTFREQPAIHAWKASDPSVVETIIQIPNEGRFILAAKVTQIDANIWHYEYALLNYNSDLSGQAFEVPLPGLGNGTAAVSDIGFHDVDYHSGDAQDNFTDGNLNFSGEDWPANTTANSLRWATQTYEQNVNANALRWGTMYNFWFNSNRPPAAGLGNIKLYTFKVPGSVTAATIVPKPACVADIAPAGGNAYVNIDDLFAVINSWGQCPPPTPRQPTCPADVLTDGYVNIDDLFAVISAWGPCP